MSRLLNLLIVDDDELVIAALRQRLPRSWHLIATSSPAKLPDGPFHAALVDMHLTGDTSRTEGLEVVRNLSCSQPHLEIIATSGDFDRQLMENGLKAGATRFLCKPWNTNELNLILAKIEEWWLLKGAIQRSGHPIKPWLGQSKVAIDVQKQIAALKGESGPILIEGESGTGKEVVARLLHSQSEAGVLIAISLAGITDSLFESEFFGHVKGAFTGADQNKMGLAEAAHGGDLFLDEIEAMPMAQQAKLLRFLETGEVRRVGAKDSATVKCRIIAASNQPLQKLVKEGKFREDLLWRLSGRRLTLPPLRQRREDIGLLANAFLQEDPVRRKLLTEDGLHALTDYSWPGNVRELKRVCEQLSLQAPLPLIRREDVLAALPLSGMTGGGRTDMDLTAGLNSLTNQFERDLITRCLEQTGEIDEVARVLQISRSNLYKKIKDYKIQWREL